MSITISQLLADLLEVVYPSTCSLCRERSQEKICPECLSDFSYIEPPFCEYCGRPLDSSSRCPCKEGLAFSLCRSVLHYKGKARDAILKLKFRSRIDLAPILSKYLSDYFQATPQLAQSQLIVPVPPGTHKGKTDAASLFGFYLKKSTGLPLLEALEKTREIMPQHSLGLAERWENVKGAFRTRAENVGDVKAKAVLLVDDIFTSGATSHNCARALMEAGASGVSVLTLCRTL